MTNLPEVLTMADGTPVTSMEQWENARRPEILNLFLDHVYGRAPVDRPSNLEFHIVPGVAPASASAPTQAVSTMPAKRMPSKRVRIEFAGTGGRGSMHLDLWLPSSPPTPAPVVLFIDTRSPEHRGPDSPFGEAYWPVDYILSRGYAAASFSTFDLDPDHDDGFLNGVHAIFDPAGPRPANAWAAIGAWAWGVSRVMDYLKTDRDVQSDQVILVGHSRGGKTSLWAGAADRRIAMAVSFNSGCTGAALSRASRGERVHNINGAFPHWFCGNYKQFNEREDTLPVDQHMLLSLIAPRLLYVSSGIEDAWCDPPSEFLSAKLTGPVYRLYGHRGLPADEFPSVEQPLWGDRVGYHVRSGGHALTMYDWEKMLDFADDRLTATCAIAAYDGAGGEQNAQLPDYRRSL